jgi:hypothetical protein
MANIYVFDPKTGLISYSIDGATGQKVANLRERGIPFIVHEGLGLLNQYVAVDDEGNPTGVETINTFNISKDKTSIVANGVDEMLFSNVVAGTSVFIGGEKVWTSTEEDTTFELSVDGYNNLNPTIAFKKYGYYDLRTPVATTMPTIPED